MSVRYGPDAVARLLGYAHSWGCKRCTRRGSHAAHSGFTATLDEARTGAKRHARGHLGMRAVFDPEG
jgi:hypothetical protein